MRNPLISTLTNAFHTGFICLLSMGIAFWVSTIHAGATNNSSAQVTNAPSSKSLKGLQLQLNGTLTQGALLIGQIAPGASVTYKGKPLKVSPNGHFVMGLGRDAAPQFWLKVINNQDPQKSKVYAFKVTQRTYKEQRINGVPQKTVTPPTSVLARIKKESAMVGKARRTDTNRTDFLTGFVTPLEGTITGVYGSRRVYNGKPGRPHYGVDIARPTGTQVVSPAPGVVTLVHKGMFYSGGTLIIDHGFGISTTYIHLSDILVSVGETVQAGKPIALVGASGRATGPHLDWRINWFKVRLDPSIALKSFPARKPNP